MKNRNLIWVIIVVIILIALFWFWPDNHIVVSSPSKIATTTAITTQNEIGETLMIGVSSTTLTDSDRSIIETVHPGSIILFSRNIKTQTQTTKLVDDLQALNATYSSSSLFISVDEEGGVVSRLPWISTKTGEPAIHTTSSAYQVALARASTLHDVGINVDLAPVLDAATPNDFLYNRTFQTSYERAGALGAAMVQGYLAGGVLSTIKHFPGYVGISSDPEAKLYQVALPQAEQFTIAATAGPAFVMVSNVIYPKLDADTPCPLSSSCITYLHNHVPGHYLVISDDLADPVMRKNYTVASSVYEAALAGVDIKLVASGIPADTLGAYNALLKAAQNGTISPQSLADEYNKILAAKSKL